MYSLYFPCTYLRQNAPFLDDFSLDGILKLAISSLPSQIIYGQSSVYLAMYMPNRRLFNAQFGHVKSENKGIDN